MKTQVSATRARKTLVTLTSPYKLNRLSIWLQRRFLSSTLHTPKSLTRVLLTGSVFSATLLSASALDAASMTQKTTQYANGFGKVEVSVLEREDGSRDFSLQTFAPAQPKQREFALSADAPQLRTQSILLDALFAQALLEINQNSVSEITDWGFNDQQPILCPCFETGAKWNYVWTRDLAYSIDLGIAQADPDRAIASLLFKTSGLRPSLSQQGLIDVPFILQDTGSGGSWPVSTDRVVWILAASQVQAKSLGEQSSAERQREWLERWYPLARNTLLQDRRYVFNQELGLYRGETSFLDWREQSYPRWTANHTAYIAQSHALSTNVLHYVALRRTAAAAAILEPERAAEFNAWADALKTAINQRFWQNDTGLYSRFIGSSENPMPILHYDLLGNSLAITHGIASAKQADQILSRYPIANAGAPVIWPALPQIPIYHNRAIWPFVSGYAIRAAKQQNHIELFRKLTVAQLQAAAFNLSNMENLELLSQAPAVDDGAWSGPVVNSERQLWSVAAFYDLIVTQLFGLDIQQTAWVFNPYLPVQLVQELNLGTKLQLQQLKIGDYQLHLELNYPKAVARHQVYRLSRITVNGQALPVTQFQAQLPLASLSSERLDVVLELTAVDRNGAAQDAANDEPAAGPTMQQITLDASKPLLQQTAIFAPLEPKLQLRQNDDWVELHVDTLGAKNVSIEIYKNGVKTRLKGSKTVFRDKSSPLQQCYAAVLYDRQLKHYSLPSPTLCSKAAGEQHFVAGQGLTAHVSSIASMPASSAAPDAPPPPAPLKVEDYLGHRVYKHWGAPMEQLHLRYTPTHSGTQRLSMEYFIDNGPVNTGITAVVKQVAVSCPSQQATDTVTSSTISADATEGLDTASNVSRSPQTAPQHGVLVMPHLATATELGQSTHMQFNASAGESCDIIISDGFNMSYLQHFDLYTGGKGGRSGPLNQLVVHAVRISPAAR